MANNTECVVLQAKQDYSVAVSPFCMHKFSDEIDDDSVKVGLRAIQWILRPVDTQTFFSDIFQKRVLIVKRASGDYFENFFSTSAFVQILQNKHLKYGRDVNVASYKKNIRRTHNPTQSSNGDNTSVRVYPTDISEHLAKGRSIQCVCPQVFDDHIWYLCEVLQEVFCSFVGANSYLTPKNSAGFAPHWDDIDAFMLQVEGKKYWKVYAPVDDFDALPLESSGNFTDADFTDRKPVFEGWIEQGDTLYIPRGFIHQAETGSEIHSHHVTVSVCRHFSYATFFENAATEFIQALATKSKFLRHSLPPLLFDIGGVAKLNYSNEESLDLKILPVSNKLIRKFDSNFVTFIPSFIDIMAKEFFKTAIPPLLSPAERELCCLGGSKFDLFRGFLNFDASTEVRLIRKHGQRLFFEDEEKAFLMHRMVNSRRYDNECTGTFFDFPVAFENGYTILDNSYPKWTKVGELGLESLDSNIALAQLLFTNCLLLRKPAIGDMEIEKAAGGDKREGKKQHNAEMDKKKKEKQKRKKKNRNRGEMTKREVEYLEKKQQQQQGCSQKDVGKSEDAKIVIQNELNGRKQEKQKKKRNKNKSKKNEARDAGNK